MYHKQNILQNKAKIIWTGSKWQIMQGKDIIKEM